MVANRCWMKVLTFMVMGAFLVMGLSSLALAQVSQELKDAAKMMSDGWRQFNTGQRMIFKGKEMNDLVAVNNGFQDLMAPGNRIIQDGRNTMDQGAKLYAQGEKTYLSNQGAPSVAMQGLDMMQDGFQMAHGDGIKMVRQGVVMNDRLSRQKGVAPKFVQGNKIITNGVKTMEDGAKLFMQGKKLYLQLKK